nr:CASP-like protein 4A2 [Aegilops tauschii subsp. strangulata]
MTRGSASLDACACDALLEEDLLDLELAAGGGEGGGLLLLPRRALHYGALEVVLLPHGEVVFGANNASTRRVRVGLELDGEGPSSSGSLLTGVRSEGWRGALDPNPHSSSHVAREGKIPSPASRLLPPKPPLAARRQSGRPPRLPSTHAARRRLRHTPRRRIRRSPPSPAPRSTHPCRAIAVAAPSFLLAVQPPPGLLNLSSTSSTSPSRRAPPPRPPAASRTRPPAVPRPPSTAASRPPAASRSQRQAGPRPPRALLTAPEARRARGSRVAPSSPRMEVNTDDMESLSDDSGWSSLDDSDIEELLQDDDVEMMGLLLDVQEFEDRAKLMDQRRGSKMGRVTIYRNRGLGHEQLMQDYFAECDCFSLHH